MRVEVVFALADKQELLVVELPDGSTVGAAIERSTLARQFPDIDFDTLQAGVWGKPTARGHVVREGDRIELYRPLEMDPRDARRLKAGG
jgi:putative ubiquitin-RnfH superfamily antitoxin RatB of RatAB toxin-antitoxin module